DNLVAQSRNFFLAGLERRAGLTKSNHAPAQLRLDPGPSIGPPASQRHIQRQMQLLGPPSRVGKAMQKLVGKKRVIANAFPVVVLGQWVNRQNGGTR